ANRSDVVRPIPLLPPVMRTTLLVKLKSWLTLNFVGRQRLSVKQRVNDADLNSKRVAISAALFLFVSVESFEADAKTFPELPNQVHTGVMSQMIRVRALRELIVQLDVPVARSRTKGIVPLVRETDHPAECRYGSQLA